MRQLERGAGRPDVVLIEFNELSPVLLDRFMASGQLPNFARFFAQSDVYVTDAGEDPPLLEPWIQWPTIHSGLPYAQHQVSDLGDGRRKLHAKLIGQLLSDAGIPVGIFGSMNMN